MILCIEHPNCLFGLFLINRVYNIMWQELFLHSIINIPYYYDNNIKTVQHFEYSVRCTLTILLSKSI